MRIVVLDSHAADQGEPGSWKDLAPLGELTLHPRSAPDEVRLRARDASALITNKVVLGAQLFALLPALRYIGIAATGTNVVDLDAARARGIAVTNVPGYSSASVAQHVMALILHLTNQVAGHDAAVKAGAWAKSPDFCFFVSPTSELFGKTLVIVGKGAIGSAVARMAEGFGMKVIAAAVPGRPPAPDDVRMPLGDALAVADVVTLHCPLTPATANMVDQTFLGALKSTALLINTSRGGLIDEAALLAAIQANRLGGAALDVLATEPPPADQALIRAAHPRLIVTPHMAWGTPESRGRLQKEVALNLMAYQHAARRNRVD